MKNVCFNLTIFNEFIIHLSLERKFYFRQRFKLNTACGNSFIKFIQNGNKISNGCVLLEGEHPSSSSFNVTISYHNFDYFLK